MENQYAGLLCRYRKPFESFQNHIFTSIISGMLTSVFWSDINLKQEKTIINHTISRFLTLAFRSETNLKQEVRETIGLFRSFLPLYFDLTWTWNKKNRKLLDYFKNPYPGISIWDVHKTKQKINSIVWKFSPFCVH